jgi:uncharacterized protein YkwD
MLRGFALFLGLFSLTVYAQYQHQSGTAQPVGTRANLKVETLKRENAQVVDGYEFIYQRKEKPENLFGQLEDGSLEAIFLGGPVGFFAESSPAALPLETLQELIQRKTEWLETSDAPEKEKKDVRDRLAKIPSFVKDLRRVSRDSSLYTADGKTFYAKLSDGSYVALKASESNGWVSVDTATGRGVIPQKAQNDFMGTMFASAGPDSKIWTSRNDGVYSLAKNGGLAQVHLTPKGEMQPALPWDQMHADSRERSAEFFTKKMQKLEADPSAEASAKTRATAFLRSRDAEPYQLEPLPGFPHLFQAPNGALYGLSTEGRKVRLTLPENGVVSAENLRRNESVTEDSIQELGRRTQQRRDAGELSASDLKNSRRLLWYMDFIDAEAGKKTRALGVWQEVPVTRMDQWNRPVVTKERKFFLFSPPDADGKVRAFSEAPGAKEVTSDGKFNRHGQEVSYSKERGDTRLDVAGMSEHLVPKQSQFDSKSPDPSVSPVLLQAIQTGHNQRELEVLEWMNQFRANRKIDAGGWVQASGNPDPARPLVLDANLRSYACTNSKIQREKGSVGHFGTRVGVSEVALNITGVSPKGAVQTWFDSADSHGPGLEQGHRGLMMAKNVTKVGICVDGDGSWTAQFGN